VPIVRGEGYALDYRFGVALFFRFTEQCEGAQPISDLLRARSKAASETSTSTT